MSTNRPWQTFADGFAVSGLVGPTTPTAIGEMMSRTFQQMVIFHHHLIHLMMRHLMSGGGRGRGRTYGLRLIRYNISCFMHRLTLTAESADLEKVFDTLTTKALCRTARAGNLRLLAT